MIHPDIRRDPPRDPEIAAWLALADEGRGTAPADPERLRTAIAARAAQALSARALRQDFWWNHAARWARPVIPLALAASLALAYLAGTRPVTAPAAADEALAGLPYLEDVLAAPLSDAEYRLLVSESGETDALANFTLQES